MDRNECIRILKDLLAQIENFSSAASDEEEHHKRLEAFAEEQARLTAEAAEQARLAAISASDAADSAEEALRRVDEAMRKAEEAYDRANEAYMKQKNEWNLIVTGLYPNETDRERSGTRAPLHGYVGITDQAAAFSLRQILLG